MPLTVTDHATPSPPLGFQGAHTRIGVFDSGLGGLSVLRALRQRLPLADVVYVADSGHAPYGERDDDFIAARSRHICEFLLGRGVDAIVVACNTATAAAIHVLRDQYAQLPIVGVEPGVKPAVAMSRAGRVGVLATPATLASDKYRKLIANHGQGALVVAQPCPGLAREIERGVLDSPALRELVARFSQPLREAGVDTVVLGCTHYPFVSPLFKAALGPDVGIVDTAEAVAAQTARLCAAAGPATPDAALHASTGRIELWTSGAPDNLASAARHWLGLDLLAQVLPASPAETPSAAHL